MVKLSKVDLRKSGDVRIAKVKVDLVKHGSKKINLEKRKEITFEITKILCMSTGEYARHILEQYDERSEQTFMDAVVANIMETSAWKDEGYYNDDDIRLAIGRELMVRLGIEV